MRVNQIMQAFEELAPLAYSEEFDNTGLLVGDENAKVNGILVTLDCLESVVDEAIQNNCNLIVSFHPIIFSGLKKINGHNYVERVVRKAIKNDIAIFAIHTALDNAWHGVNAMICDRLGLQNRAILIPQKETIKKLTTYVPKAEADVVREALFAAGAGEIGKYSNCSFNIDGMGSFQGGSDSKPTIGEKGKTHFEEEVRIGIIFPKHREAEVLSALFAAHSYEEVAYEIITVENVNQHIGMGMIAEFETPMIQEDFLKYLKKKMNTECIRHSKLFSKTIKKVAVLGGSGSFAIEAAKASGADAFVTADLKYHDFFKAEEKILLADIGHYESEQFTKDLLDSFLKEKIINFAPALPESRLIVSKINTNPVSYF